MRDVSQRLRRMLYLVPYVARHPEGVVVDDLADRLDLDREQLLKELDLLSQVGPPDGDPGEYLLVTVEDGRVFVDLPQRLTRPLRLTPQRDVLFFWEFEPSKKVGLPLSTTPYCLLKRSC